MNKVVTLEQAIENIKDGSTIMISGFGGNGAPHTVIDALVEKNVRDLTLICNDSGVKDFGAGRLFTNNQVKKVICSIIGPNPVSVVQHAEGTLEVELYPQGSLAEKIRAGGYGLGGVLTKAGLGTLVEEGKQKVMVQGEEYLLEEPLKAEFALIYASIGDTAGNCRYYGSAHAHAPSMAAAADYTILEVGQLVELGEIEPQDIHTQQVLVDAVVVKGGK
ncbi:CoA transferase subunit A [Proteiniclasticum sp. C24MP]|uniref:CoA transferase subunit A n=1 Tax=Proteiniclasticum sp. C24MP TaxID=3374101 RepID=UPI003754F99E